MARLKPKDDLKNFLREVREESKGVGADAVIEGRRLTPTDGEILEDGRYHWQPKRGPVWVGSGLPPGFTGFFFLSGPTRAAKMVG